MGKSRKISKNFLKKYGKGLAGIGVGALILVVLLLCLPKPAPASLPPEPSAPEPNPYLPEDFVYDEKGYLTCTVADSRLGIDVSEHQGQIDWQAVKEAGVEFAIIRLGYRGYSEGVLHEDAYARENLEDARAAGLEIGAYFYSQAVSVEEARQEARLALKILGGTELTFPLVYDWEYVNEEARTAAVDARTLTDCTLMFCRTVEKNGYDAMIYFNQDLGGRMFLLEELTDYPFWLAMYDDQMTYPYRVKLWQYTPFGRVPGIETDVDLNLYLP